MDGSTAIGVRHAVELIALADAAIGDDAKALTRAREAVVRAAGREAMVDAAAVIAGFDGITRIADATGIPLEPPKAAQTADFRQDLDIDRFASAKW